jgi:hypothetical protein
MKKNKSKSTNNKGQNNNNKNRKNKCNIGQVFKVWSYQERKQELLILCRWKRRNKYINHHLNQILKKQKELEKERTKAHLIKNNDYYVIFLFIKKLKIANINQ